MNEENLKELVLNCDEPFIFENLLNWDILSWNLDKWKQTLSETELQFRMGTKSQTQDPQWERNCETVRGTFNEFLNFQKDQKHKWLYFDYKYLNEWFIEKTELRKEINWSNFGFPDIAAEESTIWIGTEGAHTPCHIDTYGCNLIAQIFGRKLWLLFPPTDDLKPTRVPYEESTIYSTINFYCPEKISLESKACRKVILHPGQVLYVPNGWWHYVENLETAISVNTWIPLEKDADRRIDEALTLLMVQLFTSRLKKDEGCNLFSKADDACDSEKIDVVEVLDECIQKKCESTTSIVSNLAEIPHSENITKLAPLSNKELIDFLSRQSSRFGINENGDSSVQPSKAEKYLRALTDPEVIKLLKSKLKRE